MFLAFNFAFIVFIYKIICIIIFRFLCFNSTYIHKYPRYDSIFMNLRVVSLSLLSAPKNERRDGRGAGNHSS